MEVKTSFGTLLAKPKSLAAGEILAYLSIPYAEAGRFEQPRPFVPSSAGPINSLETFCFPQRALHTRLNRFLKHHMMRDEWSVKGDRASEQAFVLNVWTRRNPQRDPVLVFIHGSGDCNSGTTPIYNGENLAARGIVFVTVTYRIGRFGYMPVFDGDRCIANLAYCDQQMALAWIRSHIAELGGDPENITLMGHSGGALAANHHYLNDKSSRFFDKLILCGGPIPDVKAGPDPRDEYEAMLKANRLNGLNDLKALSAKQILKLKKAKMREVLDGDFFKAASKDLLQSGAFSPKPILIGSNADELSMVEMPVFLKFMGISRKARNLDERLKKRYGAYAEVLRRAFEGESEDVVDLQIKISEALIFHYSVWHLLHVYGEKSPVYGYRLNYVPNLYGGLRGAYHGAEAAIFFDNLDKMKIEITEENRRQSEKLQEDWLTFMRTGRIPGAEPYRTSGKIISYEGEGAVLLDFPHADLMTRLDETDLPARQAAEFMGGR